MRRSAASLAVAAALALAGEALCPDAAQAFEGPYIGALLDIGAFDVSDRLTAFAAPALATEGGSASLTGVGGTLAAGWNFRVAHRVLLGIETDYSFGDWSSRVGIGQASLNHLFTLRGRLGYVVANRWMLYGTAGLATASTEISGLSGVSVDAVRAGWTIGGGFEYEIHRAFNLRAEVLWVDFGGWTFNTPAASHHADFSGVQWRLGAVIPLGD